MKNEAIPRLRFNSFHDKWENIYLNDISYITKGTTPKDKSNKGNVNFIKVNDINKYTGNIYCHHHIGEAEHYGRLKRSILHSQDILFSIVGTLGRCAIVKPNMLPANTNQQLAIIRVNKNKSYNVFLFMLLRSESIKKFIHKNRTTGAQPSLSLYQIEGIPINCPSLPEQQLIGKFFAKLDKLIQLQQKKVSLLKKLKRGYLQKLFPRKGESVPRVRFKGFHDKWMKNILGELADISTGSLNANAMVRNGKYNFYTSGVKVYKINNYKFNCNAITIAGNGASVGYMHLASGKFNAYQRTYVLYNIKPNREYLFCIIHNLMPRLIHRHRRAGNVPYIVIGMLKNLMILIPTTIEQTKIGDFFINLTKLIDCQNYKLIQLRKLKKAYLQKMFC